MESVHLVSFDGAPSTTFKFQELNDPVMGGKSSGTWAVDSKSKVGVFDGDVANVPSLKAPGFIKSAADGKFPDASGAINGDLVLNVRTSTPEYKGFRVSFVSGAASPSYSCAGGGSLPFSRGCFKAKFSVPAGSDFTQVRIPFTDFSDKWSPATGEQTSTCAKDKDVCPIASKLAAIQRIEIWAEGALGHVHLEVKDISAQVSALGKVNPASFNTCKGPVQSNLRYNISSRTQATIPVPVGDGETLAEAVCCDSRTKVYAEPQFLYQAPDIAFFSKLKGVTTFYDPVCGIPLFRAPMNRTMAEFKADTDEHGWPSFRSAEVISENVHTEEGGFVYSKCGTHLGSFLPDSKGSRWCMDLSCVSGNPAKDGGDVTVTI
jgi:hypothetical protein